MRLNIHVSLATLIVGHVVICFPGVLRTTLASLAQIHPALEECARDLGAGGWQTFVNVTLPLARGGIVAGAFIGFMASFDNVAISLFLADARSEVLPIRLWDLIESVLDVRAAAASGVLIVVTVALMIVIERIAGLSLAMSGNRVMGRARKSRVIPAKAGIQEATSLAESPPRSAPTRGPDLRLRIVAPGYPLSRV